MFFRSQSIRPEAKKNTGPHEKSISRSLALSLVLFILVVSLVTSGLAYREFAGRLMRELEKKADEQILQLSQILPTPVWTYDYDYIRVIGNQLRHSDQVAAVGITDITGKILFEFADNAKDAASFSRQREIFYEGEVIGHVSVDFITGTYRAQLSRMVKAMLLITVVIVAVLLGGTGILLRVYLRYPLATLNKAIDQMASGVFVPGDFKINYKEFAGIIERFKISADQVRRREASLKRINRELQSEMTERERTEQALQHNEAILRATLESTRDGILVVAETGAISHHNVRFRELWSLKDRILTAADESHLLKLIRPLLKYPDAFCQRVKTIYQSAAPSEDLIQLKDGRYIERFSYPLVEQGSVTSGRVWFFRDITERVLFSEKEKLLEAQLRQSQKMEAIGTLAGGIAHDFNNILAAITGYAELSLQSVPNDSELADYLNKLLQASSRARDLVRQILTFSRQTEIETKPVQLTPITKEAVRFLRSSLPTTIKIREQYNSSATVMADPTQLYQVLMNLCTNAGYAMKETGGELEITLDDIRFEANTAAVTTSGVNLSAGEFIKLTVADTGPGIPREIMDRIFEPFFTTKNKNEGTGMGLSMVHGIVEGHGGTITVESVEGNGTRFEVYLPVTVAMSDTVIGGDDELPQGSHRILFVDDEPFLADLGQQLLESIGYQVIAKTDSAEALNRFREKPGDFDLVITDLTMPRITGDRLAQSILEIRPELPVILCTGYTDALTEDRYQAMGIRGVITKPFQLKNIATLIYGLLN